jgi:undecaprenyl-diphosphatase
LAVARKWRWVVIWMLGFGGYFVAKLIKVLIDRPRPVFPDPLPIIVEKSHAFPSGHAVGATIIFALVAYFIAKTRPTLRLGSIVLAGWLILLIGFSRIYLGVHWFSDVLGGVAFGLGWVLLCIAAAKSKS